MNVTLVSIVVNGALVTGSTPAVITNGIVSAPLDPYVRAVATQIVAPAEPSSRGIVLSRGSRCVRLIVGSRTVQLDRRFARLPSAPYFEGGIVFVPLAATARGLGGTVAYEARTRTLTIAFVEAPLATLAPAGPATQAPPDLPTFAPTPTPAPEPTISGIPKPRRTPIPVGSGG